MQTPSSDEVRQALIADIAEFSRLTGTTKTEIGRRALNDVSFVSRLESGGNITLKSLETARLFLEENWPGAGARKRGVS